MMNIYIYKVFYIYISPYIKFFCFKRHKIPHNMKTSNNRIQRIVINIIYIKFYVMKFALFIKLIIEKNENNII